MHAQHTAQSSKGLALLPQIVRGGEHIDGSVDGVFLAYAAGARRQVLRQPLGECLAIQGLGAAGAPWARVQPFAALQSHQSRHLSARVGQRQGAVSSTPASASSAR